MRLRDLQHIPPEWYERMPKHTLTLLGYDHALNVGN